MSSSQIELHACKSYDIYMLDCHIAHIPAHPDNLNEEIKVKKEIRKWTKYHLTFKMSDKVILRERYYL